MEKSVKIAFFDSGVGGVSVLQEVLIAVPGCEIVYIADSEKFPYGLLSEKELIHRVRDLTLAAFQKYNFDICVIACNTASTVVLPTLRESLPTPVVGVVPAVKPASALTSSGTIGLLATPGTIRRSYTDKLIEDFAGNLKVIRVGSAKLVELAERKIRDGIVDLDAIESELNPFREDPQMDVLVLACTHFPLLEKEIKLVLGPRIKIISSGEAVANRIKTIIEQKFATPLDQKSNITYIETNPQSNTEKILNFLSGLGNVRKELLDLTSINSP